MLFLLKNLESLQHESPSGQIDRYNIWLCIVRMFMTFLVEDIHRKEALERLCMFYSGRVFFRGEILSVTRF